MKKIKDIKSGLLKRNFGMAKIIYKVGSDFIKEKSDSVIEKGANALAPHSELIFSELAMMKGSALKVGQMLSVYGDYFLPEEFNRILKKLQNQTHYLDFEKIRNNIPNNVFSHLEVETIPFAAASIGQVHKAVDEDKNVIALKVQYPNISKAIGSDMLTLKLILKGMKVLPKNFELSPFLDEVREMMVHEMNYKNELGSHLRFYKLLSGDLRFHVPHLYEEFCSETTLASEYIEGLRVDSDEIKSLDQNIRNQLACDYFELFLKEFFSFHFVQTDPHYGNYALRLNEGKWQWVLFDFGSVKEITGEISHYYKMMMKACILRDKELYFATIKEMRYFTDSMKEDEKDLLWQNAKLMGDPFQGEIYDWGSATIADDLIKNGMKMFGKVDLDSPPKEIVFLDRKIGGVFMVLKILRANIDLRELALRYLDS